MHRQKSKKEKTDKAKEQDHLRDEDNLAVDEAEVVETEDLETEAVQDDANEDSATVVDIDEMQSEIDALKEDLNEANDVKLRLAAEYDNFRKRSRQEKDELYTKSIADVCALWLPVLDNLERALKAMQGIEHEESKLAADGVTLVQKQAEDVMGKLKVTEIPALGETFDPALHEAVMHIEDEGKGTGEIVEVFLKGYKVGDKVLRHSVVKVAN